jgi:hypothetical protein
MTTTKRSRAALLAPLAVLGTLALGALAETPDEKARRAQTEAALDETRRATVEACGAPITARVEWAQMPQAVIAKYSVASYCGAPLEGLRTRCAGANARAYIAKNVGEVVCRFAPKDKGALTIKGKTIDWAVDFEGANLEALAKRELVKKL